MEKERKRKRNEKKVEGKEGKAKEMGERAKTWQSFAKKGKGGKKVGESMFRSPEDGNPNAKVGVVGSGKGMTVVGERKRQTFQQWTE